MPDTIRSFARDMASAKRALKRDVRSETREAGIRYAWQAKSKIVTDDIFASGELTRGISYHRTTSPRTVSGVKLVSSADHSAYVEAGVGDKGRSLRVGKSLTLTFPENPNVPVPVIVEWGYAKPTFRWNGNPWNIASSIANKIAGNEAGEPGGVSPQPFFHPSVEDAEVMFLRETERAVRRRIR